MGLFGVMRRWFSPDVLRTRRFDAAAGGRRWQGSQAFGWINAEKELGQHHVHGLLQGIIARGAPIAANRTFAMLRKVFNFAIARGIIQHNPCHGLARPAREHQRDRVLAPTELRLVWQAFDAEGFLVSSLFRLHLLTAQRGGELRMMRWEDVDLDTGWWTIPASHAKNGLAHRVPLVPDAVHLLRQIHPASSSPWVFGSSRTDGPRNTIAKALQRVRTASGVAFWPHDLRRTAASHMTSLGVPRLTVAKILNHAEQGVTAVYARHSYDREKRAALDVWALALNAMVLAKPPIERGLAEWPSQPVTVQ